MTLELFSRSSNPAMHTAHLLAVGPFVSFYASNTPPAHTMVRSNAPCMLSHALQRTYRRAPPRAHSAHRRVAPAYRVVRASSERLVRVSVMPRRARPRALGGDARGCPRRLGGLGGRAHRWVARVRGPHDPNEGEWLWRRVSRSQADVGVPSRRCASSAAWTPPF